jgi:hypothetical protein
VRQSPTNGQALPRVLIRGKICSSFKVQSQMEGGCRKHQPLQLRFRRSLGIFKLFAATDQRTARTHYFPAYVFLELLYGDEAAAVWTCPGKV